MMRKHKETVQKNQSRDNIQQTLQKNIRSNLMKAMEWPYSFADTASNIILGLFSSAGVWHKKIAQGIVSENQIASEIRSIQRFFSTAEINYHMYGNMIYTMLRAGRKVMILLDRTNWKYGKTNINIFVAAIICNAFNKGQSFAVPIVWEMLEKAGTSNTRERIMIMKKVLDIVGRDNIDVILGDREFIGDEWITFLLEELIPFVLRIRNSMYVEYKGSRVQVKSLCKNMQVGEKRYWNVKLNGKKLRLAATMSKEGELVIVIAPCYVRGGLLNEYRLRWLIELFFKSIKSRGFNIEDTHMTDSSRIKVLFAMISYATALAVLSGIVYDYHVPITIKNHGRPTYSLFTYGFDFIRELLRGVIPSFIRRIKEQRYLLPLCWFLPQNEFQIYALPSG
jgi:hypothetical protein